jgi:hypothetical protein
MTTTVSRALLLPPQRGCPPSSPVTSSLKNPSSTLPLKQFLLCHPLLLVIVAACLHYIRAGSLVALPSIGCQRLCLSFALPAGCCIASCHTAPSLVGLLSLVHLTHGSHHCLSLEPLPLVIFASNCKQAPHVASLCLTSSACSSHCQPVPPTLHCCRCHHHHHCHNSRRPHSCRHCCYPHYPHCHPHCSPHHRCNLCRPSVKRFHSRQLAGPMDSQ